MGELKKRGHTGTPALKCILGYEWCCRASNEACLDCGWNMDEAARRNSILREQGKNGNWHVPVKGTNRRRKKTVRIGDTWEAENG